ncbi:DUF7674 family protein [Acinetobacter bereziniae]|uniref:DUF7674 family protein n=1 Tax=Acinetobacter bereziniae TaxID=106648 RepID=UPI0021E4592D|nr:hypothetical protein [Acinetobacter bereziniae]MCV2442585.1 hypothetical protein [Acinetobacter bereziniae]
MEIIDDFIVKLIDELPMLKETYENELNYWYPKKPPLTLLMSDFGREIVNLELSDDVLKKLMVMIENGLNSKDDLLSNAIATGLLETLYFNFVGESKSKFLKFLEKNSKHHINILENFYKN